MPDYGNPSYWDERYAADDKHYDWYQDFSTLENFLSPYLRSVDDFEILIPGCGNSRLGADFYDRGFLNITNIDISTVVIDQMSNRYADREEMEYTVMDARNLEFIPDQCFDIIVDKALFDAILCSENNLRDIQSLLTEMYRVLKTGGVYLIISHGPPENRLNHINRCIDVEVQVVSLPKPDVKDLQEEEDSKFHYLYICTKYPN